MVTKGDTAQMQRAKVDIKAKTSVNVNLTPLKIYLLAYNVANLAAWGSILYLLIQFLFSSSHPTIKVEPPAAALNFLSKILPSSVLPAASGALSTFSLPGPLAAAVNHLKGSYNYKNIGTITAIVQSFAVLEIVHAAMGWVRSDVTTTTMQVASRLWSVWGIVEAFPSIAQNHPLYTTMVTAWSLAEVIRYSFYAFALVGLQPKALNWLRYTAFYALYPIGAGSEAFLSFSTLPSIAGLLPWKKIVLQLPMSLKKKIATSAFGQHLLGKALKSAVTAPSIHWDKFAVARLVLFVIWWPALYSMFSHMQRQRRKVFGRGRSLGGVPKTRKAQ